MAPWILLSLNFPAAETPGEADCIYNVPLVKEQSYTQNIPEAIQSETEEYSLITSGNKEVSADIDQSLINLRPIVPSPPETYTIIFNGNGGTASQTSMETGTDGTLDTLPTASRDGNYRFDGWFTEPTGGVQITTSTVFTKETTVYAHWVYIDRPTDDDHLSGSDSSSDPSYRIDVDVITRGGNVSVRPTSASVGTRVAITVDSDSGYELDRIVVLNEGGTELALTQRNENTYTFIMPDGRVSIDAHFVQWRCPVPLMCSTMWLRGVVLRCSPVCDPAWSNDRGVRQTVCPKCDSIPGPGGPDPVCPGGGGLLYLLPMTLSM